MEAKTPRKLDHPLTVVFFGISGAGKGTQAQLLEQYFKAHDKSRQTLRVVMGDLLREYMETGSAFARHTREVVTSGGLLPGFIPNYALIKHLDEHFTGVEHIVLDGTCRTPVQSAAHDEAMNYFGRTDLHGIVINLSREAAFKRLVARGRADDQSRETILNRFAFYNEGVVPAINSLREHGWQMHDIEGDQTIEKVYSDILDTLDLAA